MPRNEYKAHEKSFKCYKHKKYMSTLSEKSFFAMGVFVGDTLLPLVKSSICKLHLMGELLRPSVGFSNPEWRASDDNIINN